MGRININFHVSHSLAAMAINPDAIPGKDLAMVLLSLPGNTYVTGCVTGIKSNNTLQTDNTIEATNDQLPDGTNIICRYSRTVTMVNGTMQQFDSYDGMVIEQPKSAPYQVPVAGWTTVTGPVISGSGSLGPCHSGHNWKTYTGLHNTEEYCTTCGIKK